MTTNASYLKTLNGYYLYDETAHSRIDEFSNLYLPLTGGTVSGPTIFSDTVTIGNAILSYDSIENALVISFTD